MAATQLTSLVTHSEEMTGMLVSRLYCAVERGRGGRKRRLKIEDLRQCATSHLEAGRGGASHVASEMAEGETRE